MFSDSIVDDKISVSRTSRARLKTTILGVKDDKVKTCLLLLAPLFELHVG